MTRMNLLRDETNSPGRMNPAVGFVCLLAVLALAIWHEIPHEGRTLASKCELLPREDIESSANEYRDRMASGYRGDLRSHRVTLVALRGEVEPAKVLNNVCEQRWYVAKLVRRLSDARAALIVIDKFFAPNSCDPDDPGTLALIHAAQDSSTPIVSAVGTHSPESDPKGSCLILSPSLDFGNKRDALGQTTDKPAVNLGTSRLNADFRKVPLNWYVYASDEAFRNNENPSDAFTETLPYLAAALVDGQLREEPRLSAIRSSGCTRPHD